METLVRFNGCQKLWMHDINTCVHTHYLSYLVLFENNKYKEWKTVKNYSIQMWPQCGAARGFLSEFVFNQWRFSFFLHGAGKIIIRWNKSLGLPQRLKVVFKWSIYFCFMLYSFLFAFCDFHLWVSVFQRKKKRILVWKKISSFLCISVGKKKEWNYGCTKLLLPPPLPRSQWESGKQLINYNNKTRGIDADVCVCL